MACQISFSVPSRQRSTSTGQITGPGLRKRSRADDFRTSYMLGETSEYDTSDCCEETPFDKDLKECSNPDDGNDDVFVEKKKRAGIAKSDPSRLYVKSSKSKSSKKKKSKETMIFNVGGVRFETYKSTLKKQEVSAVLSDEMALARHYREDKGDYFFDRDPRAFHSVLNYLRTAELHIPTYLCGPALQAEFEYWGIDELEIERCCWSQYNTWKTQCRSLEKLENDRKLSTTQLEFMPQRRASCWTKCRANIWSFLQDPTSSTAAKVYGWISIVFVMFSIFSFCSSTHPDFRVTVKSLEGHPLEGLYFFPKENATSSFDIQNSTSSVVHSRTLDIDDYKSKTVPHPVLLVIDLICLSYFTAEFLIRFLFCPKKKKFITSPQNIIDLIAILPDYVEYGLLSLHPLGRKTMVTMDFLFILRMLRLCRIFRLIRHVPGLWIMLYTLKASFNELALMCVFLLIGMVTFASLIHYAEGENEFQNIPVGFWWSVVTMTTVGYGDIYPKTALGYVIGSLCAISGLLMIAFTVPIIVSNFVLYYTHIQYGLAKKEKMKERTQEKLEQLASKPIEIHISQENINKNNKSKSQRKYLQKLRKSTESIFKSRESLNRREQTPDDEEKHSPVSPGSESLLKHIPESPSGEALIKHSPESPDGEALIEQSPESPGGDSLIKQSSETPGGESQIDV